MNALLAATLLCLCNLAGATPAVRATPSPPGVAAATAVGNPSGAAPATGGANSPNSANSAQGAALQGSRGQPTAAPRPPPVRERGLLLAGFALMAGITLRRLGDGSP